MLTLPQQLSRHNRFLLADSLVMDSEYREVMTTNGIQYALIVFPFRVEIIPLIQLRLVLKLIQLLKIKLLRIQLLLVHLEELLANICIDLMMISFLHHLSNSMPVRILSAQKQTRRLVKHPTGLKLILHIQTPVVLQHQLLLILTRNKNALGLLLLIIMQAVPIQLEHHFCLQV